EVILEESSSSLDEGIGLSNTEDSSDDQTSAKVNPTIAAKPALATVASKSSLRKQKKEKAKHYHCEICDERFTMKKHLREHQGSEHPGQNCEIQPARRRALHSADESVREKGRCRYKCVICSKSFREERELRTHFKLHEADDCPFQCGMCGILNLNQT
uniref:C2H2-type domain-containing protein n=1 Tax=Anopheles dirus TaxID=7168 RepID=A0A182NY91_9DIPT